MVIITGTSRQMRVRPAHISCPDSRNQLCLPELEALPASPLQFIARQFPQRNTVVVVHDFQYLHDIVSSSTIRLNKHTFSVGKRHDVVHDRGSKIRR